MKPVRTLIALVSEKELRLLTAPGTGKGVQQLRHVSADDFPDTDVAFSDRPGRGQAAPGMARHGFVEGDSEQRRERERFADHVAGILSEVWDKGTHDRILLAAGPRMLGQLRQVLPEAVAAALMADLDKDLVKIPTPELPRHLQDVLAL